MLQEAVDAARSGSCVTVIVMPGLVTYVRHVLRSFPDYERVAVVTVRELHRLHGVAGSVFVDHDVYDHLTRDETAFLDRICTHAHLRA